MINQSNSSPNNSNYNLSLLRIHQWIYILNSPPPSPPTNSGPNSNCHDNKSGQSKSNHNNHSFAFSTNVERVKYRKARHDHRSLIQHAAQSLSSILPSSNFNISSNEKKKHESVFVWKDILVPCIASCTMAISNVLPSSKTTRATATAPDERYKEDLCLDDGSTCAMTLLQCILKILQFMNQIIDADLDAETKGNRKSLHKGTNTTNNHLLVEQLRNAAGGSLIAGIVQSCLTALEDGTSGQTEKEHDRHTHPYPHSKGNLEWKLLALNTFTSLLQLGCCVPMDDILYDDRMDQQAHDKHDDENNPATVTTIDPYSVHPLVDIWRELLPGCFLGLYRAILDNVRYSAAQSSTKVASQSMKVLSILLRITLAGSSSLLSSSTTTTIKSSSSSMSHASALFMNVTSQYVSHTHPLKIKNKDENEDNNHRKDNLQTLPLSQTKTTTMTTTTATPLDHTFLQHVHARLPGPLSILLSILPSHRSPLVRKACVQYLCVCLLVHTQDVWTTMTTIEKDVTAQPQPHAHAHAHAHTPQNPNSSSSISSMGQHSNTNTNIHHASLQNLDQIAMDCTLTMLADENDHVASYAKRVLQYHKYTLGKERWKHRLGIMVLPKTFSLLEEVGTLARRRDGSASSSSGRGEVELRSRMNLLIGYLNLSILFKEDGFGGSKALVLDTAATFSTTLLNKILNYIPIRYSLCDLFTLDKTHLTDSSYTHHTQMASTIASSTQSSTLTLYRKDSLHKFTHMREEKSIQVANRMMDCLTRVLGIKGTALVVDSFVADLTDGLMERMDETAHLQSGSCRLFCDEQHAMWLDGRRTALIVLANQLLLSAKNIFKYMNQTELRILNSLANALFPILLSEPLWNLPTNLESVFSNPSQMIEFVSSSALLSNALVTSYILETLSTICGFIFEAYENQSSTKYDALVRVAIYPILRCVGGVHPLVQRSAIATLEHISTHHCTNKEDNIKVTSLLLNHFDEIMYGISLDLRMSFKPNLDYSKSESSFIPVTYIKLLRSVYGVMKFLLSCLLEEREGSNPDDFDIANHVANKAKQNNTSSYHTQFLIPLLETMNSLVKWFDSNIQKGIDSEEKIEPIISELVVIFGQVIRYLLTFFPRRSAENSSKCPRNDENFQNFSSIHQKEEPVWIQNLHQFKICDQGLDQDKLNPRAGFMKHHSKLNENNEKYEKKDSRDVSNEYFSILSASVIKRVIRSCKLIMTSCSFYLSVPHIRIRRSCCDTLNFGFLLLSAIEFDVKMMKSSDSEAFGNPFLVSIHEYWPSVKVCLLDCTSNLTSIVYPNLAVNKGLSNMPLRAYAIILESILGITSELCEVAGEFMAERIINDVWPNISKILILYTSTIVHANKSINTQNENFLGPMFHKNKLIEVNLPEDLLLSILRFLSCVFCSLKTHITKLVPVAGIAIFPLVQIKKDRRFQKVNDLIKFTHETMRAMLLVDSDSLWRGLMSIAGRPIPNRLLLPFHDTVDSPNKIVSDCNVVFGKTPSVNMADDLLHFLDSLPEPILL